VETRFAFLDALPPEMVAVIVNKLTRGDAFSFRATSRRNNAVFLANYQHLGQCSRGGDEDSTQRCEDDAGAWRHVPYISTRIDLMSIAVVPPKKVLDVFHSDAARNNWILRSWLNRAFSSYTPHTHNARCAYELPKRPAIVLAMHDPERALVKCWDARMWTWTMKASSACDEVFTAKSTRGRQLRTDALVIDGKIIPATVLNSTVNSCRSIEGSETGVYFYQVLQEPTNKTRESRPQQHPDEVVVGDVRGHPGGRLAKTLVVYDVTSKQIVLAHTSEAAMHKTLRTGYMVVELPPVLHSMSRPQADDFVKQVHDAVVFAEVAKMKEQVSADECETATLRCFLTLVSGECVRRTTLITTSKTPSDTNDIHVTTSSTPPSFRVALTRQSKEDAHFRVNVQRRHIASAMTAIVNPEVVNRKRVTCMAITRANESIDALPPRNTVQMARMTAEMIEHITSMNEKLMMTMAEEDHHHRCRQLIRVCNTKDSITSWWDELCLYLSNRWTQ
jgi:hypothetical protein